MGLFFLSDPLYLQHHTGFGHPEQPARAFVIQNAIITSGLNYLPLHPRKIETNELLLCHTSDYIQLVRTEVDRIENCSKPLMLSTGDVFICKHSYEVAKLAAGGVLAAVDKVMGEQNTRAFCAVRPPGHHACSNRGMGFCLFNQVALAARYAQQKYALGKVLIVDWDVHHGNGTQEIFYTDPSVFYFSTHQAGIYPGTGFAQEIGEGAGKGFTLNVPIQATSRSREEVLHAFSTLLREKMEGFRPELVLISAGFDAHVKDPLGQFNLTDQDFANLTKIVKEIAEKYAAGRLLSVLEGGYNLSALASASLAHLRILAGE